MPDPLYSSQSCSNPAYQLDWSYSLFWRDPPGDESWLPELQRRTEKDQIRILQHQFQDPNLSQFLISTRPSVAPLLIAQRVKGRLQHLLGASPFRRNYALRSVGSTRRDKLLEYLAGQLDHHALADARVDERLRAYQIHQPEVDLARPQETSHARYWYNLHIVLVNADRLIETQDEVFAGLRDMILAASRSKGHRLSRAALLPDHLHLALGCNLEESPEEVVLGYLNNLAFARGMRAVFRHGYFVGTFSEYDLGVIPRA
jgi:REP element-mobilizing transposase RayT